MIFTQTKLKGAYVIELERITDSRGFFARGFCMEEFAKHGLVNQVVQTNISYNMKAGTIRGLHYQVKPYEEVKFTRCIKGKVFDVIVDLRRGSKTFGQYFSIELSDTNNIALYVPANFAHGYMSLEDDTMFMYNVSCSYTPNSERLLRWDDPEININWPIRDNVILSDKDRHAPGLSENLQYI